MIPLDSKLITDVTYIFKSPNGTNIMGGGDAMREIVDELRKEGIRDTLIETYIHVNTDKGLIPLSEVTKVWKTRNGVNRDDIMGTYNKE